MGDISEDNLQKAKQFITHLSQRTSHVEKVLMAIDGSNEAMNSAFEQCDIFA